MSRRPLTRSATSSSACNTTRHVQRRGRRRRRGAPRFWSQCICPPTQRAKGATRSVQPASSEAPWRCATEADKSRRHRPVRGTPKHYTAHTTHSTPHTVYLSRKRVASRVSAESFRLNKNGGKWGKFPKIIREMTPYTRVRREALSVARRTEHGDDALRRYRGTR